MREPSFHSWNKPRIRIKAIETPRSIVEVGDRIRVIGIGIIRTISTSNTRKITAKRKNRKEKGIRAVFLGSNPHS